MTDNNHPIIPPPELFKQWEDDILNDRENVDVVLDCAWKNGYRAGADAELEACCEWVKGTAHIGIDFELINARRPKPTSLKGEVQEIIECLVEADCVNDGDAATLRRVLEFLPK